jgi:hypothetical protein
VDERKPAAGLLLAKLWEAFLIGLSVGSDEGGGIHDPDAQTTPEVFAGHGRFGLVDKGAMDFIQALQR